MALYRSVPYVLAQALIGVQMQPFATESRGPRYLASRGSSAWFVLVERFFKWSDEKVDFFLENIQWISMGTAAICNLIGKVLQNVDNGLGEVTAGLAQVAQSSVLLQLFLFPKLQCLQISAINMLCTMP